MIDDILYDKIHSDGSKRIEKRTINEQIEVEFEVTIKDGNEEWNIKTITVSSKKSKVVVDGRVIHDPNPPVYTDDGCYVKDWQEIRNVWSPSQFNYVGMSKK